MALYFSISFTHLCSQHNITNRAQMYVQILSTKFNKESDSFKDMNLHLPFKNYSVMKNSNKKSSELKKRCVFLCWSARQWSLIHRLNYKKIISSLFLNSAQRKVVCIHPCTRNYYSWVILLMFSEIYYSLAWVCKMEKGLN